MTKLEEEKSAGPVVTEKAVDSEVVVTGKEKQKNREIKGGIPYVAAPGVLKKILDQIIISERPDKFNSNYMATILGASGGAARAVPPFLKKMQFIGTDSSPTPLYSRFKTDSGRSQAAYEGLRNAFLELFKRNEYIHKANEEAVKDVIVEITGLTKSDSIVRLMYSTFDAVRVFVSSDLNVDKKDEISQPAEEVVSTGMFASSGQIETRIGLSYQINIVLPETENVAVFNAIFRSLRENLLR